MTAREFLALHQTDEKKLMQNRSLMISAERRAWEICSRSYFEYTSEFEDRLWAENEELSREMAEVENAVGQITDEKCREVLWERYISGKKWTEIAEKMLYSEQHIHRLHQRALKMVVIPMDHR